MERCIVICAPVGQDASLTAKVLASVGIGSIICKTVPQLVDQLKRGAGAILIVEDVISGAAMRPLAEYVAAQPTWSDIPLLLLTRSGADSIEVQRAVELLGNVTLVERPVRTIALITAARSAIRARERQYQVRDADQRKDEFLATLAHELRNPLAPIRTSMSILHHLHSASAQITQVREVVERQVAHLTRLVDDLLDVARITNGKVMLKKAHSPLQSVINHAVEIAASGIQERQHKLLVEAPETPFLLNGDYARLVQSVANLLVNAGKFTPPGGLIQLSAEVEGPVVTFRVRDNGIGMAPESLAKIFDLFAQTPVPGEAPTGLGIGLNLAKQFAEMHGGTLQAHSEGLGKGSVFVLSLPVVLQGVQPSAGQEDAESSAAASPDIRKVLVVDDNVDAANTLNALLDMDGFRVTAVYDGHAAIAAVEAARPDVVIMDIGMPGMNGYDAARQIRERPGNQDIFMVALTGWGQPTDRTRARTAGFDHHFVKPVDYEALMKCLHGNIRRTRCP